MFLTGDSESGSDTREEFRVVLALSEKQVHRNEKKRGRKRRQSPQRSSRRLAKSHHLPVKIEPVETAASDTVEPSPPGPIESLALNENIDNSKETPRSTSHHNQSSNSGALNQANDQPLDEIDQIKMEMPVTVYEIRNIPIGEDEFEDLPDETDSFFPVKEEPSDNIFCGIESFLSIEDPLGQLVKTETFDYDDIGNLGKF